MKMRSMYSRDTKFAAERLTRYEESINEKLNFPSMKLIRNKILRFVSKPEMDKMGFGESKKIEKLLSRTLDSNISSW